jgi:hypothetical protein
MKTKKEPKKIPKTQNWHKKKSLELAKKIAVIRDGGICQKCGRSKDAGYQIHGSHILSVGGHPALCATLKNIKALCATCHAPGYKGSWHDDPGGNLAPDGWFHKKYPGRLRYLIRLEQRISGKQNWEEVHLILKKQYKSL